MANPPQARDGSVVYDDKPGEDDTSEAATALDGGGIVIHKEGGRLRGGVRSIS